MGEIFKCGSEAVKYKFIVGFFKALMLLSTFLLVAYVSLVRPTTHCITDQYDHLPKNKIRETIFLKTPTAIFNKEFNVSRSQMKTEDRAICQSEKTNNYMKLIPDFKHMQKQLSPQPPRQDTVTRSIAAPPLNKTTTTCKDSICSEHLSTTDITHYCFCLNTVLRAKLVPQPSKCKFISGIDRDSVALVSLPGSGNTWVRGMLESLTGICTGAIYCDISLRYSGFAGENIQKGSVLVVKTHKSKPTWTDSERSDLSEQINSETHFGSAVFLIRNPQSALVSEWNRIVANNLTIRTTNINSHTANAGKEWFGENKHWSEFVMKQAKRWKEMLKNWVLMSRGKHPVLVVKYESLLNDTFTESKRILDFLQVSYDPIRVKIQLKTDPHNFQRKHSEDFDHFTPSQKNYIQSIVLQTILLLQENGLDGVIDLSDYL